MRGLCLVTCNSAEFMRRSPGPHSCPLSSAHVGGHPAPDWTVGSKPQHTLNLGEIDDDRHPFSVRVALTLDFRRGGKDLLPLLVVRRNPCAAMKLQQRGGF